MSSLLDEVVIQINKKYGANSCRKSASMSQDPVRLPTGIFALDYATSGGFPLHQITIIRGPENGGKTSTAMATMAAASKICWRCFNFLETCNCSEKPLPMQTFWVDIEGTFNPMWAEAIGCDPESYVINMPDDGNQAADMMDLALEADNCGLIILDSVGAIMPSDEAQASSDDRFVGNQARLISNISRKLLRRLAIENKNGHPCLVVMLNQLRRKIGYIMGSNEEMPGGEALKHAGALRVRINKISMLDKKNYFDTNRNLLLAQRHTFTIEKYKNLILAGAGEFVRAVDDIPIMKAKKGEVLDHKTVLKQVIDLGLMTVKGATCSYNGKKASKQDFIDYWKSDKIAYLLAQRHAIVTAKEKILNGETNMLHVSEDSGAKEE